MCRPMCGAMIADLFTPRSRGVANGIFSWGVYVGFGMALFWFSVLFLHLVQFFSLSWFSFLSSLVFFSFTICSCSSLSFSIFSVVPRARSPFVPPYLVFLFLFPLFIIFIDVFCHPSVHSPSMAKFFGLFNHFCSFQLSALLFIFQRLFFFLFLFYSFLFVFSLSHILFLVSFGIPYSFI